MLFVRGGSQVTGFHDPLCEGRTTQQRENDGRKHFSYVSLYLSHSSGYSSFNVMPSKAMPSLSVMASFLFFGESYGFPVLQGDIIRQDIMHDVH